MAFDVYDTRDDKDIRLGLLGPITTVKEMGKFIQYSPKLDNLNAFFKTGFSANPKAIVKDLKALHASVKIPMSLTLSFTNLENLAKRAQNSMKIVQ